MNEEETQEIAIRIRDEFEDLLTEKGIKIPSADRTGDPGEARLFGEESAGLVEAIVGLLLDAPDSPATGRDAWKASHPLRQLAIGICDAFEDLLEEKNITIPSEDRTGRPEEARLYGDEYYALEDAIVEILVDAAASKEKRRKTKQGTDTKVRQGTDDDAVGHGLV